MAIYRGPGGSGDATGDSANQAQVAETFSIQAGVSAAAAAASATTASNAATAAGVAQTAAEDAQTAAETAETNAETAETNAETAQSAAEAAQLAAEEAQTAAELAETNAETAETNAEAAQTAAEAAQLAAEEAQTAAELAETNAETAETGAVAAQLAAESARDSALAAYDNFDDRYLGAKTSDPTLDNDGDALVAGALYFNSVDGAMRVYTGSVWVDAYAAGTSFLAKANNLSDLPNVATARQNLDLEIGVDVQAFDATILKSADIGVTVQGYDADTAKYDDATANFTGTLQNGGSNVVVDSDIGVTVQAYDATIVVDADIGVTVQGYDADTTKNDVSNTFTQAQVFPSGSVSSPSITTTGDTNTGIFFPAADTIGLTVGGVESARLVSGTLSIPANSTAASRVRLYEDTDNGTNYVDIIAPAAIASDSTLTLPSITGTLALNTMTTQVFTTTGANTYTRPTGLAYALVYVKGGGASGASTTSAGYGASGGEGEEAWGLFTAATIGATQTVTIGAGGAAVTANTSANGNAGGTTSFGALLTAAGAAGGTRGNFGGAAAAGGSGGTGGFYRMRGAAGVTGADTGGTGPRYNPGGGKGGGIFATAAGANSGGGGGGGSTGNNSGAGGSGICVVYEYY